ncbi:MAG: caspase family protein, partial [Parvibaculaceae bacterium]
MLGRLLLLIALLSLGALPAAAANRLALVIGIDLYEEIPPLRKAVGDAGALGSTLERLGFAVTVVTNANRRELNRKLSDFQASIRPGDIALVHFSGHGVELDGQNFLLPADVPAPRDGNEDFLKDEAVSLVSIVERLRKSGVATSMVIVDACRDNPFAGKGTRSVGGERGLARVEAPAGTLILYSAGYGQSALDRLGETDTETTSVYTRVLIKHLERPGVDITDIAKDVRDEVEELAATVRHVQRPAYYDELRGRLILKPAEPQSTQQTIEPETTTKQAAVEPKQLQEKAELIDKIGDWALQCGRSGPTNATVCGGTQAVQANPHDIAGTLALMKDESDGSMSLRVAVSTGGYFPKGVAITAAGMKVLLPYRYCEGGLCVASEKMPATIIRMLAKARSIEIQVYGGPDVTYSLAVNSNGLAELAAALERLSPEHVRLLMRPERNILVAKSPSRDVELDASWNLVD